MATDWRTKYFERIDCKGIAINEGQGEIIVQGEVKSETPDPTIVYWAPNPPTYSSSFSGSALPYHDSIQAYDRTPNVGAVKAVNRKFEFRIRYPNAYYVGLGSLYVPPHIHFKVCEKQGWSKGTGGVRWLMPEPNNLIDNNNSMAPGETEMMEETIENQNVNRMNNLNQAVNNKNTNNNKNMNNLLEENNIDLKDDKTYHTIQLDDGIPFRTLTYPAPPSKNPRTSPMFYHCSRNQLPVRGQEKILRDAGYPDVNKMPDNFWGLKPPN
jgi:hypothetical protein